MNDVVAERLSAPAPRSALPLIRRTLSGPAMGSRWAATVHLPADCDADALGRRLADRVEAIEARLSRFRLGSEILRFDTEPLDHWIPVSADLLTVLARGLDVGRRSAGAFDVGLAAEVAARGFGAGWGATGGAPRPDRRPAFEVLEIDLGSHRVLKRAPIALDLAGIGKGHAVDELARVVEEAGIASFLVGLDGELRAGAAQPDGRPWAVGIEAPSIGRRDLLGRIDLVDRAVGTSGNYRRVNPSAVSHTLDPATGTPVTTGPASVTALAPTCAAADAWATALIVLGRAGIPAARAAGVEAILFDRHAGSAGPIAPTVGVPPGMQRSQEER